MIFDKEGSGPPVVLIHGLGASAFSWKQAIPALSPHFTIYAVDLLGFGRSSPAPAAFDFTVPAQAEAVRAFMQEQHLPEPIIIIGHSMGGSICLQLAAQSRGASPSLEKMVLIDPVAPPPLPSSAVLSPNELKDAPEILAGKILKRIYMPGSVVDSQVIAGYAKGLSLPGQIEALRRHSTSLLQVSFPQATLGAIKTETLIIWGKEDPILPPDGRAEELRAALFQASLEIVTNCGHVPQEEAPEITNKLIGNFLK
jgi:pimeloyl-ACP methyl ester carboxylesterase